MYDEDVFLVVIAFVIGIFLGVLGAFLFSPNPVESYRGNVCKYEGGEVQGEVCIVDGKVFEIEVPNE